MADPSPARRLLTPIVELAGHDQLSGRRLAVGAAALAGLVVLIGAVDSATGSQLSFGIFYFVPVTLAVSIGGSRIGVAFAAVAAAVWVVADRAIGEDDPALWLDLVNVGLRFSILGVVVALLAAIRDALRVARDSDRRSREFLAFAAHQLRTPTASVSATSQTLLARGQDPGQEEALVRLVSESDRIGRLVSSILRFVRLDQGDPKPRRAVDLGVLCATEAERHKDIASTVQIELDLEPGAPLVVNAIAQALQEAVGNLLDNATRHARTKVVLTARSASRHGEVLVVDDGPGLPPGAEERAFDPFITLDGHPGTGLGLPIARRLVEAQGGTLRYEAGAFVLTIPMVR